MKLNNIFQFFLPGDKKFFPLIEKAAGNLLTIAKTLQGMVNSTSAEQRNALIKEIERLEHVGDNITHEIFHELNATFITPFDREDIYKLTAVLDDIVDNIHGSSKRFELYKVTHSSPTMTQLADLIEKGAYELHKAISQLKDLKNVNRIKEACVRINSIENHADDIFDNAVARLFEEEKNAVEIIKIKEILASLERATDNCEDAANVLESIIVKNA